MKGPTSKVLASPMLNVQPFSKELEGVAPLAHDEGGMAVTKGTNNAESGVCRLGRFGGEEDGRRCVRHDYGVREPHAILPTGPRWPNDCPRASSNHAVPGHRTR